MNELDIENNLDNVITCRPNVVIAFFAPQCAYCKLVSYFLSHLSTRYPHVHFCKYNIDANPDVRAELKIQQLPATFFYKDGKVLGRYYGNLEQTLADCLTKYYD